MTNEKQNEKDVSITIIDSVMGSGKTSYVIQRMNESLPLEKFIYITPYLDEFDRIKKGVKNRTFKEPTTKNEDGSKLQSLKELVVRGENVMSTHALFTLADEELITLLKDEGYTLILDEVMQVVEQANVKQRDIKDLLDLGHISVEEGSNRVKWNEGGYEYGARYYDIKLLAQAGNLFYYRGKFLIWTFPAHVFEAFNEVFILTYLFHGQLQRYYYDLFGFNYVYKAVQLNEKGRYELVDYNIRNEGRKELYDLITIHTGKIDSQERTAYSSTKLQGMSVEEADNLQKEIYNFVHYTAKAKGSEVMWTALKGRNEAVRKSLSGKGYARSFVPVNARATNKFKNRKALVYVYNRFMNPIEKSFFQDNGVTVDEDLLAVSDLLQWVWRSRIREGEPIDLYLPSKRMRTLLKKWANYEI